MNNDDILRLRQKARAHRAEFLKFLREMRTEQGMSQVELAKRLGKDQAFVSKCERGIRRIDILEFRAFCNALDMVFEQVLRRLDNRLKKYD